MKRITSMLVCLLLFGIMAINAQDIQIRGKIISAEDGNPLPGVSVVIKGTLTGIATDVDGNFAMTVPSDATLVISSVGYKSQEIAVAGQTVINLSLEIEVQEVDEIIVTALGIQKEKKSIGYAVQEVDGESLAKARETNVMNSLSGKVAGVNITSSSGAVGASTRVELRGSSSLTGSNQPLYVVDGIPLDNSNYSNVTSGGGFDTPNGIADMNPDDIESVTVLKGPVAAALYGVRAANGVIQVTTKKGKASKAIGVTINHTTTFDQPLVIPSFQNSYGQGPDKDFFYWADGTTDDGGVDESWGPPLDRGLYFTQWNSYTVDGAALPWVSQPDNVKNFYDLGVTHNTNVSFTGGGEKAAYRMSMGYMDQKGIIPGSNMKRYTINGSASYNFTPKLSAGLTINYTKNYSDQLPEVGYTDENPIQQTIWSGRNVDFEALKDYENLPLSPENTPAAGTPINWNTQFQNNPYWVLDNNKNGLDKDRIVGGVNVGYKFASFLSATVKTSIDQYSQETTIRKAIGTNSSPDGYYAEHSRRYMESNSELMISFNKALGSYFNLSLNVAGNVMYRKYTRVSGVAPQLELPELYTLANVKAGATTELSNFFEEEMINSIYGFGAVSFKNALFLEFTGRNDWASVLPVDNNSFFYPSVNLSVVWTDLFNFSSNAFSFFKTRAGWSKVGSVGILAPYALEQTYAYLDEKYGDISRIYNPDVLSNPDIKPESKTAIEVGLELRFLSDRIQLDATGYHMKSSDLIVEAEISAASGYVYAYKNIGEMTNMGIEALLGVTAVKTKDFRVDLKLNYYKNINEVTSLGGLDALILGGQWDTDVKAIEGEPYGVIFGPGYLKNDDGEIIHVDGLPQRDPDYRILGNYQPDWRGGVILDVSYKNISLSTTFDGKFGGDVYSMTTTWGRYAGVLEETLLGRETGFVGDGVKLAADGVTYVPNDVVVSSKRYNQTAFDNTIAEGSVFDASFIKWRELILTFQLPSKVLASTPLKGISLSLVGRNLAILYKNIPHVDPEVAFSAENDYLGMEFGTVPSTRSLGFNININF
ncbi:MAG: SusC/RagA family TonB-linked outer membrane protein [Bacteroidales bacterium]|nr:SusC/RagA family TonB-linked outer membrane protein [Bacteroidales bacterium]